MTDDSKIDPTPTDWNGPVMQKRIARRYAAERRFKALGLFSVLLSTAFLAFLLFTMLGQGVRGFQQTEIALDLDFPTLTSGADPAAISGKNAEQALNSLDLPGIVQLAAIQQYGAEGDALLNSNAAKVVREALQEEPTLVASKVRLWVPASSPIDIAYKHDSEPAAEKQVAALEAKGALSSGINRTFLTGADATDPAAAGSGPRSRVR